jgi:hypothetical protein
MSGLSLPSLVDLRRMYHRRICELLLGIPPGETSFSNADKNSNSSMELAARLAKRMPVACCNDPKIGPAANSIFTRLTSDFVEAAFDRLRHIRPGDWEFSVAQAKTGSVKYDQYEHLDNLVAVLEKHKDLKAALGGDYLITPDIVISRAPVSDVEVNSPSPANPFITPGETCAGRTPLRSANQNTPRRILHASISCKWTIRSDRSQNSRTEALNLIRNRKGNVPHIAVVIFEPLPSRIASIAMGTGDIDCTYHGALHELLEAVDEGGHGDMAEMLHTLVDGRRLRDISDLPFDMAV